jgi:flagellar motor switch/type III secretory pathway protein FliN
MSRKDFQAVEDICLSLSAELDRRTISFPELMNLEVDSVLTLTRPTGENVDLYAGKVLIGYGEILVVETTLAVRVADLHKAPAHEQEEESRDGALSLPPASDS